MKINLTAQRFTALLLASSIAFLGCTATTVIQSVPEAAKVYIDGEPRGTTPYHYADTKIVGSVTTVKLEKEGFEPLTTSFSRSEELDVGALIGGLLVYIPLLWVMKYKPMRTYELAPVHEPDPFPKTIPAPQQVRSKAERLREMKKLLDDKIITPAEYEKEKKKILDEQ